jgi:hypothetical protein
MDRATFWAIFSQTRLATLHDIQVIKRFLASLLPFQASILLLDSSSPGLPDGVFLNQISLLVSTAGF